MDANVGITPEMIYFNLYAISYFPDKKTNKNNPMLARQECVVL